MTPKSAWRFAKKLPEQDNPHRPPAGFTDNADDPADRATCIAIASITNSRALETSTEDRIGTPTKRRSDKRGPALKIKQQLEQIGKLPATRQRAIAQALDAMLPQNGAYATTTTHHP